MNDSKVGRPRQKKIDHIKPKSKLLFRDINDANFKRCWSLSNLRPLDARENLRRGDNER